jgi:hypothetical protein
VYEPLRVQGALLSSYHEATKRTDNRKPTASNGLYTLLGADLFILLQFEKISIYNQNLDTILSN